MTLVPTRSSKSLYFWMTFLPTHVSSASAVRLVTDPRIMVTNNTQPAFHNQCMTRLLSISLARFSKACDHADMKQSSQESESVPGPRNLKLLFGITQGQAKN